MDHIDAMDQLRDGIGLRAFAQRDPINEYKMESYDMFEDMVRLIREDTVRLLFLAHIEDHNAQRRRAVAAITGTNDVGIALFEATDGKVSGEIHYTEPEGDSEFYHKINGITEDQYFESIPYAG